MRDTKVWAISLPPLLAERADRLAREEQRTRSEMVREALRQYIALREWDAAQSMAARRAAEMGIADEEAVERLVDEVRH
ncbi:MAG: ribbon-helix-helix protein, CopG family [Thermoanaerobacterales bacterium]|nr:ribbon-helix-helix protein, CopG family [Bacillota bacterium]MDI6907944.1 ribbon-helix-helix protein, CopG family [Thermoanaerobacterales bacterium]